MNCYWCEQAERTAKLAKEKRQQGFDGQAGILERQVRIYRYRAGHNPGECDSNEKVGQ